MLAAPQKGRTTRKAKDRMNRVIMAIVLILVMSLILIPLSVNADSGIDMEITDWDGDGYWRHDTWYIDLYPGEEVSIELELEVSEDAVVYVGYDMPRDLFIYFDPAALEIEEDDSEWLEITVYAPGDTEPNEYEIDFAFRAIILEPETEIVYRDRYTPGPERIKYINRYNTEYIDRIVPKYIYIEKGVDWWWIPISVISAIFTTLFVKRKIDKR